MWFGIGKMFLEKKKILSKISVPYFSKRMLKLVCLCQTLPLLI